jgi:poly(A) polymerase
MPLPAEIRQAIQRLNARGHLAYVNGGSVRDFLLGREPKDHDLSTDATPDEICEIFPDAITVGKSFGVLKFPGDVEIASFRRDLEYSDHRRPEGVELAEPEEDALRRDFTINGMFYDPKTQQILDCVGGADDLRARVVRAIGDPDERFKEDALRLLRAIRFTTELGFRLDLGTMEAIKRHARLVLKVSAERIRDELEAMWLGADPAQALGMLSEYGLLFLILPEVQALRGVKQMDPTNPFEEPWPAEDVWSTTLKTVSLLKKQTPRASVALMWASVLMNVGKPIAAKKNAGKHFNGHELEAALLIQRVGERLRLPRSETERIVALSSEVLKFGDVFQMREATLLRWIAQPYFEELLSLHRAEVTATDGNLAAYEFCSQRLKTYRESPALPRLLDGADLIQMGFLPGPQFTKILRMVEDLALERKITTKDEALEFVVKYFV